MTENENVHFFGSSPRGRGYAGVKVSTCCLVFWATVLKRFPLRNRTVVCPVCLKRWCIVAKLLNRSRCHLAQR